MLFPAQNVILDSFYRNSIISDFQTLIWGLTADFSQFTSFYPAFVLRIENLVPCDHLLILKIVFEWNRINFWFCFRQKVTCRLFWGEGVLMPCIAFSVASKTNSDGRFVPLVDLLHTFFPCLSISYISAIIAHRFFFFPLAPYVFLKISFF